ncbi:MBL fold metallo-hydrolase [Synechococcus sp. M16CYN]|uniref:MBL fold metallo-hydrolase n=1 Tax=Synechococcus sp. M16CYN TaxID=3103139 RepID=UPI003245A27E
MTTAVVNGQLPQQVRDDLWLFPPNRDCQGGSSWWLDIAPEPVLIDCPPLTEATITSLKSVAGTRQPRILLTSREGHGRLQRLQQQLDWPVLVQEQEAYLLPNVTRLDRFQEEHTTVSGLRLLWTPGPTPGSTVVFAPAPIELLFCGRLLTPLSPGCLGPLRNRRTFHWPRQLASLVKLRSWIPKQSSPQLASGAGLGRLKGGHLVPYSGWSDSP